MIKYLILLLCLIMCVFVESCEGDNENTKITGLLQTWTLESFGKIGEERPLIPDTEITIEFDEEKKVRGSNGCNQYFGKYEAKDDGALTVRELAVTEMACLSPEGVMEQEQQYLDALLDVSSYEIEENHLQLYYDEEQNVLNYILKE